MVTVSMDLTSAAISKAESCEDMVRVRRAQPKMTPMERSSVTKCMLRWLRQQRAQRKPTRNPTSEGHQM